MPETADKTTNPRSSNVATDLAKTAEEAKKRGADKVERMAKRFNVKDVNLYYGDFHAVKDVTMTVEPNQVTRIVVRWAPTDIPVILSSSAQLYFPFDPSGNGKYNYVWHCHIIDHEDNEMMRPTSIVANPSAVRTYVEGVDY